MGTTKASEEKLLTGIYHNIAEADGFIEGVVNNTNDPQIRNQLIQAKQILQGTQNQIVETVIKNVVEDYQQSEAAPSVHEINLDAAVTLITEIEKKAKQMGMSVVTAVYNASANPVAVHCMDGAYIASFDIASNKAYTSAALKMPTSVLKNLSQPGKELYGIQYTNQGRIVIFGGGEPLYHKGKLIGALGVSGGTEQEDTSLAEFGKDIMEEVIKW